MSRWTAAMRAEDYAAAWTLAAQTLAERDPTSFDDPTRPYHLRWVWRGERVDGRDVLVRCYHGLGDTIQFLRFLPLLAKRAASVTVELQPHLLDIVPRGAANITLRPFDVTHPLPPREVDVEITELDFALRAAPNLAPPPYLGASPASLPEGTVAFCYGSGDWDPTRSVPVQFFARLGKAAPCITLMPEATDLPVLNPQGCPLDITATARLIAGAELVITVDTMIAHLAGAMGKPTWLLLKSEPDWRWAPDRRTSAWYPATRLYVQPRPGEWEPVMMEVEKDLTARGVMLGRTSR